MPKAATCFAQTNEAIFFGVHSKGLTKRNPVGLGGKLANLRSDWWIITIKAKIEAPICFIMTLKEVKELCQHSDPAKSRTGAASIWLQPSS